MLMVASLLFVSVMAANAQVSSDSSSVSGQPPVSGDMSNYTRDMEVIQSSEVPASLRSTLQGSEFSGWEEGKVYRNSSTNEYLIVIGEEDAKVYRFDANGTRVEDTPADSGNGSLNDGSLNGTGAGPTPADSTGSMNSGSGSTVDPSGSTSNPGSSTGSGTGTPETGSTTTDK